MNATNRVVNRIVLGLAAMVFAALAAVCAARAWWPAGWDRIRDALATVRERIDGLRIDGLDIASSTLLVGAIAVVVLALALWFLATRGGGHTSTVFRQRQALGQVAVDRDVADAVLTRPLRARTDVLSADTGAFVVRKRPAVRLTVRPRAGADLSQVMAAVESVVAEWDALTDTQMPVVLYLADRRVRDGRRAETRVS